MGDMLKEIRLKAILVALMAWYVAPALPLVVITSIPNFYLGDPATRAGIPIWQSTTTLLLFWFWALAPVGSGYLAAKLAKQQPLLHGLVVGLVGGFNAALWVKAPLLFELGLFAVISCSGLFGGWLWRCRTLRRPPSNPSA